MAIQSKLVCTAFTFTSLVLFAAPNFSLSANLPQSSDPSASFSTSSDDASLRIAQALRLGGLVTELESNIKWSAVEDAWRGRRNNWLSDVNETTDPASLAELLVELESNVKWSAVQDAWRGRRDGWIRSCQSVKSAKQLAPLLLELESNIKWSAVQDAWRGRRDSWVREVQSSR